MHAVIEKAGASKQQTFLAVRGSTRHFLDKIFVAPDLELGEYEIVSIFNKSKAALNHST